MARTKKAPRAVVQYENLSFEMRNLYDRISLSFGQKSINALRDEARKLNVESPTTLGKDDLIKRITDRIISDYLPQNHVKIGCEHSVNKNAELLVQGLLDEVEGLYRIGNVLVPSAIVADSHLRVGDLVEGTVGEVSGEHTLTAVNLVEGEVVGKYRHNFNESTIIPKRSFDNKGKPVEKYIPDLETGERVIFENMTQKIACDLIDSFPYGIGLFLGVEPESSVRLENNIFVAPFDYSQRQTNRVAKLALERAKRLCERDNDVVLVIYGFDSLSDRDIERAIFGSGRSFDGFSLTIIADVNKDKDNGIYSKVATRIIDKINF